MNLDLDRYRVKPDEKIHLAEIDPADTSSFKGDKQKAKGITGELSQDMADLQERLYAEHQHAVLIVLQGMDTSGKDGTIEHVFMGINPQGVRVASFKAPTAEELSHDFLWRIHQQTPAKGEITIFNRSHYEDVLIVRVHNLVPGEVWRRRYKDINNFERTLAEEGTTILKFFLHINKEEQKQRLIDRLDDTAKHWKFNPGDLKERDYWEDYQKAYEDALQETSTKWAPWYIVPANHKWFRNLFVAAVLHQQLKDLNPQPVSMIKEKDVETYKKELEKG
jgi:PPK2 family polyphosphate:nucleotide phosphotransferase